MPCLMSHGPEKAGREYLRNKFVPAVISPAPEPGAATHLVPYEALENTSRPGNR